MGSGKLPSSPPSEIGRRPTHVTYYTTVPAREGLPKPPPRVPTVVTLLRKAEEFKRLMATSEAGNQAEIAERVKWTRARVTQVMKLLKLDEEIRAWLLSLPPGTPMKLVTERQLRPLLDLPHEEQVRRVAAMFPSFARQRRLVETEVVSQAGKAICRVGTA